MDDRILTLGLGVFIGVSGTLIVAFVTDLARYLKDLRPGKPTKKVGGEYWKR